MNKTETTPFFRKIRSTHCKPKNDRTYRQRHRETTELFPALPSFLSSSVAASHKELRFTVAVTRQHFVSCTKIITDIHVVWKFQFSGHRQTGTFVHPAKIRNETQRTTVATCDTAARNNSQYLLILMQLDLAPTKES